MKHSTALATLLLVLWTSMQSMTAGAMTLRVDSAFYQNYPFIFIVDDDEEPQPLSDETFFDVAAKVVFPVNKTMLPLGSPLLQELERNVIPHINADSLQLLRMVFRGAASPEGSVANNQRLGQERVKNLYDWVTSRMAFPVADGLLSIDADIEDYQSLCLMMSRANDPDYAFVKDLCDRYQDQDLNTLKTKLRQAQYGRLWNRLLLTYFPQLRTARFVIYLRKVRPLKAIVPEEPVIPEVPVDTLPVIVEPVLPTIPTPAVDTLYMRRELLSVKTNLLFYGVYMPGYDRWCPIPNVAIEYYPKRGHFTFGASFDMPWWQDYDAHKYFQLRNYQLETRYYLKSSTGRGATSHPLPLTSHPSNAPAFSGFYVSAYAHVGLFGICFDANRGWVGEGGGAGLGIGYVTPISRNGHWRLEFGLQAGYFRCKYDPYKYENPINPDYHDDLYYYKWTKKPELFKKRQYRWNWIGPTRIGVTLTYDLLYRRIQKRGASFKSTERRIAYE